jgi:hypothetical protein
MEQAQLQLIFNVVSITGLSSLASLCYMMRKDNRKLAAELKSEPKQDERTTEVAISPEMQVRRQKPAGVLSAAVAARLEIRHLAAERRAGWVKGFASAISPDGSR